MFKQKQKINPTIRKTLIIQQLERNSFIEGYEVIIKATNKNKKLNNTFQHFYCLTLKEAKLKAKEMMRDLKIVEDKLNPLKKEYRFKYKLIINPIKLKKCKISYCDNLISYDNEEYICHKCEKVREDYMEDLIKARDIK